MSYTDHLTSEPIITGLYNQAQSFPELDDAAKQTAAVLAAVTAGCSVVEIMRRRAAR